MKLNQKLSLITIGVQDLEAIRRFYEEKLEWKPAAVNKDIVFYLVGGMLLSFFPQEDLEKDAGIAGGEIKSKGFTLAYLVETEQEVDELFAVLEKKGVKIVKRPEKSFFGSYGGHFADVEGNLWDLACNPYIEMDTDGNITGHKDIKELEQ